MAARDRKNKQNLETVNRVLRRTVSTLEMKLDDSAQALKACTTERIRASNGEMEWKRRFDELLAKWPQVLGSATSTVLLLLVLGLAPASRADEIGPVIYVVAGAADLVSTEYALAHQPPWGSHESNPLMRGTAAKRMAVKAGFTAGFIFLDRKVKSRAARWGFWAGWILAHGWIVRNNLRAAK